MTQEEKYKEALLEARAVLEPCLKYSKGKVREALDSIDNELKRFESKDEDERIRKALINLVCTVGEYYLPKLEARNKMLDYLEKQKEQKPVDEQFPPLEGIDAIKAKYYDAGFKNGFDEGVDSVKPAEWSEEDKRMFSRCIKSIECSKKFADSETYKTAKDVEINWLKDIYLNYKKFTEAVEKLWSNDWSEEDKEALDMCLDAIPKRWKTKSGTLLTKWLKDNIHLQPKQEWSEEDEKMLTDISWAIRHCAYDDKKKERVMKWFNDDYRKALRPSWKPNDEQYGMEPFTKLEKAVFDMLVERTNEITISEKQARKYAPVFLAIAKDEILGKHWKPSEEQMEALHTAMYLEEMQFYGGLKDKLRDLYVQLKKL